MVQMFCHANVFEDRQVLRVNVYIPKINKVYDMCLTDRVFKLATVHCQWEMENKI